MPALALRGQDVYMGSAAPAAHPENDMPDTLTPQAARDESDPPLYFEAHLFVCTNRRMEGHKRGSCAAAGSEKLKDYMKARAKEMGLKGIRVNTAGCLDRCEFGPAVVIYPEGVWYRAENTADIDEILQTHVREHGRVARLMLTEKDIPPGKG